MKTAIIDGNAIFWRAAKIVSERLVNSEGGQCGGLWQFEKSISNILEMAPEHFIPVFDYGGATWRNKIYKDYKANRPPVPGEFIRQMNTAKKSLEILGAKPISLKGYEADDIIAEFSREHSPCVIVSPDKDLLQLVTDDVTIYTPTTKSFIGVEEVEKKLGISPELVAEFLAIKGDVADNIPGLKGYGDIKTARLLKEHGTMESIVAAGHDKQILENLELTKLNKNVPVSITLSDYKTAYFDVAGWREYLREKIK